MTKTAMTKYRDHTIAVYRSTICGLPAWRYETKCEGHLVQHGWFSGSEEQTWRYAKHGVDQRLAVLASREVVN